MKSVQNIAAYQFLPLSDLKNRRQRLQALCKSESLKGTILLSPEGVNLFVAGRPESIAALLTELRSWPGLETLQPKVSETEHQPFRRMLVRIKKEIIAFGVEGIDPARRTSPKLAASELKRWLDEGRPITLLDTRNDYEVKLGTFKNALPIGIDHFRDFPAAVDRLAPELKDQPIVMFCTGGIRCEKAGPYMEREGFKHVYQLDGGILKYFEEVGGEHYDGECFVFDQRVGVDPSLQETDSSQCFQCQTPLNADDQSDPRYVPGESCPYCFKTPVEQMTATISQRNEQIRRLSQNLPGREAQDHFRPILVPERAEGQTLLETLCRAFGHVPMETWLERFQQVCILDSERRPVAAGQIVHAGERYLHKLPGVVEPDVDMRVEVLHEDEAIIVVNKPAPLPMHAGGRFFRNTLQHVLDEIYHPQRPKPSHRLDGNTTGVVVVARTRHFAGLIQPQFARGEVEKVYLVRVKGEPADDAFTCDAPISAEAGKIGARCVDEISGLPACTEFRVLERFGDGTSLLEARPRTGRTNQIRIHLAHLGLPVCGDPAYLSDGEVGDTQVLDIEDPPLCLHASRITFTHPLHQAPVTFTAPSPSWTRGAMNRSYANRSSVEATP